MGNHFGIVAREEEVKATWPTILFEKGDLWAYWENLGTIPLRTHSKNIILDTPASRILFSEKYNERKG